MYLKDDMKCVGQHECRATRRRALRCIHPAGPCAQPSRYVAGSSADSSDASGTLIIGGIAAVVAIAVAAVAITGNSQTVPVCALPTCFKVLRQRVELQGAGAQACQLPHMMTAGLTCGRLVRGLMGARVQRI